MATRPHRITDLSAAVIGTGFIGRVHIEALRRMGVRVSGLLGSSPERGAEAAAALGIARAYANLDELLADDSVDVVHVASPNNAHFDQVHAIVSAGRHVVCEKPLALSSSETATLLRTAEEAGVVHAVNYNVRHYSQAIEARERIAALGPIRLITGSYKQDWLANPRDWNWRAEVEIGGPLRAVADIGSHLIDLLMFVTDQQIESVRAQLITSIPERQRPAGPVETFSTTEGEAETVRITTDDAAIIELRFAEGVRAVITVSQISQGHKNSIEFDVAAERGSVAWASDAGERLWLGHQREPNQVLDRDPSLQGAAAAAAWPLPGGHAQGFPDTFVALYRSVYARVLDRDASVPAPFATFADGDLEARIMDAVLASAAEDRWVTVADVSPASVSKEKQ